MPQYNPQYYDMTLRADQEQTINSFISDCINYQVVECDYNYQFWRAPYHSRPTSHQNHRNSRFSTNSFMLKKRPGLDDVQFLLDQNCDGNYDIQNTWLKDNNYQVYDVEVIDGERYLILGSTTTQKLLLYRELTNGKGSPCLDNIKDTCETDAKFSSISGEFDWNVCSYPTFVKHMWVKGNLAGDGNSQLFIWRDAAGIAHTFIKDVIADVGDFVYIDSTYLAGQYVEVIQKNVSFVDETGVTYVGIEVTPVKGFNRIGEFSVEFHYSLFRDVGEILSFPTANGIAHIHEAGNNICDTYIGFDGNTYQSGQTISGLGMTSWGGISYLDLNKGTFIWGEPGTQMFYTGNFQELGRSYTDAIYFYDQYVVLLGQDSMMAMRPIYDTQGNFVTVQQQLVSDNIGYFSRGSWDTDNGYAVLVGSDSTIYTITPQVQYQTVSFQLDPLYSKYDEELSWCIRGHENIYVSATNRNWYFFITTNEPRGDNQSCIYTKIFQRHGKSGFWHKREFDDMVVTGYKNNTWFGQGVFCENCEATDNGVYFPTHVIFRHGDLSMYSPKILTYIRYMFGNGTRFIRGDNRITYGVEYNGYRQYTHAGFMQTKSKHLLSHNTNDDCRSILPEQTGLLACNQYEDKIFDGHGRDNRNRHITNCLDHQGMADRLPPIQQDWSDIKNTECGLSSDSQVGKVILMDDNLNEYYHIMFIDLQTVGAGCFDLYGISMEYAYPEINLFKQEDNMVYSFADMYDYKPMEPGKATTLK